MGIQRQRYPRDQRWATAYQPRALMQPTQATLSDIVDIDNLYIPWPSSCKATSSETVATSSGSNSMMPVKGKPFARRRSDPGFPVGEDVGDSVGVGVGFLDGALVGLGVGALDEVAVGTSVVPLVGPDVGTIVGRAVGTSVGVLVGFVVSVREEKIVVGPCVGEGVGGSEGFGAVGALDGVVPVGAFVIGFWVGRSVGNAVGVSVGFPVGEAVGVSVTTGITVASNGTVGKAVVARAVGNAVLEGAVG